MGIVCGQMVYLKIWWLLCPLVEQGASARTRGWDTMTGRGEVVGGKVDGH